MAGSPVRWEGGLAARNSLFILGARLAELGASIAIAAVVARVLGVAVYGRYALIVAFVMLFGQFISFGLEHIVIRELARDPGRIRELLGAALSLEILLGATVVPAALAASLVAGFDGGERWGIAVFGVAFALRALYEVVFRSTFVALGAAQYETFLAVLFQGLRVALVVGAATGGWGVTGVLAAVLAAEVVNAVIAFAVLRRRFAAVAPSWDVRAGRYLLTQAWPIAAVGILNNVYLQQDALLIKWLTGDYAQVGYFAAAYRLVTFFIFVSVPMLWPLLPVLSKAAAAGVDFAARARRAARATLFFVLPVATLTAFFAPQLIRWVFGPTYVPAAAALTLLAFTMAARPLGYVADATLIARGRQGLLAAGAATAVAVNLALNRLLIPRMGFVGAAWATIAADGAAVLISWSLACGAARRLLVDRGSFAPAALTAAVAGGLWLARGVPPGLTAGLAVLAFIVGTAVLLSREERAGLLRALRLPRS